MDIQKLVEDIGGMTVLELNDLVKAIEEKFGVSAQAAMPMMAMPTAGAAAEEQTEFDVLIKEVGSQKIKVIKVVREITSLGLKEAKDLVDGAPCPVKQAVSKDDADKIREQLEEVGAVVEIK
jgi:large subunit ribosomal protein L7/L12